MVTYKIPHQARFLTTTNRFSSNFGTVPGKYSFTAEPACRNQVLLTLAPSTVYFINTLSFGGNISEELYFDAISEFPLLYVRMRSNGQMIYEKPLPITNYFDGNEASAFVISDTANDAVLLTLTGVLNQTAPLVGVDPVTIQVQFNIFAIDSSYYQNAFRDGQEHIIGQSLRS